MQIDREEGKRKTQRAGSKNVRLMVKANQLGYLFCKCKERKRDKEREREGKRYRPSGDGTLEMEVRHPTFFVLWSSVVYFHEIVFYHRPPSSGEPSTIPYKYICI